MASYYYRFVHIDLFRTARISTCNYHFWSIYTGLSAEKILNFRKRLIDCVFIWERPVKEIHCTWSMYVNSHESTGINENKPGILWILVFTLETELKYSCGEMNCSIISTWKTRIQCKNTWISMLSPCHMHTVHSILQGNWGHAPCMHCAFFNHMHRWFVEPWLIEATLVSPKHSTTEATHLMMYCINV